MKNEDALTDVVNGYPHPLGTIFVNYKIAFMIGKSLTNERVWIFKRIIDAVFKQRVRVSAIDRSRPGRLLRILFLFTYRTRTSPEAIPF
jgi:hypothetical protein